MFQTQFSSIPKPLVENDEREVSSRIYSYPSTKVLSFQRGFGIEPVGKNQQSVDAIEDRMDNSQDKEENSQRPRERKDNKQEPKSSAKKNRKRHAIDSNGATSSRNDDTTTKKNRKDVSTGNIKNVDLTTARKRHITNTSDGKTVKIRKVEDLQSHIRLDHVEMKEKDYTLVRS